MSFATLRGVTRRFVKGEHEVVPLHQVDLEIGVGEFLVLLGPSGSGKTTLLNLLAGIDRADEGTVSVGELDLTSASRRRLARWRADHVGYVFQQANLVPVLTAYENVELPLWLLPLSRKERHARVSLALEAVGLSDRASHLPKQLSGGQEQRVAIARAIVADPPLIVADEPTGNLDAANGTAIMDLLFELRDAHGATLVLVTHSDELAARCDRVVRLRDGRIDGTMAEAAE